MKQDTEISKEETSFPLDTMDTHVNSNHLQHSFQSNHPFLSQRPVKGQNTHLRCLSTTGHLAPCSPLINHNLAQSPRSMNSPFLDGGSHFYITDWADSISVLFPMAHMRQWILWAMTLTFDWKIEKWDILISVDQLPKGLQFGVYSNRFLVCSYLYLC